VLRGKSGRRRGSQLNTIIESWPAGQVALGGGFSTFGGSDVSAGVGRLHRHVRGGHGR
jgi:hypothetical protein